MAPVIVALVAPVNCTMLVPAVKLPLLIQLPTMVWVKLTASNVTEGEMVIVLFIVTAAAAVFVPALDKIRLL